MRGLFMLPLPVLLLIVACAPLVEETDPLGAERLIAQGAVALDVRTPEEFATGHIPGAINLDYYSPGFPQELAALDRDQAYLVYCGSGRRSRNATIMMQEQGFRQVSDLVGGIAAWRKAGLATT